MKRLRFYQSVPPDAYAPQRLERIRMVVITIWLALAISSGLVFGVAVRAGIAADFDQRIALDAQHILLIHSGPHTTCPFRPNPSLSDCRWPGSAHRRFSVEYLTLHGVQLLLWFQLPSR
jgi:hypothetical protein